MKDLEAELNKKFQISLEEANLKNQEGVKIIFTVFLYSYFR
jgi:hypothetical protein